jgi:aryl-alcohol dehydrogenase-like predicted oxidoreductase
MASEYQMQYVRLGNTGLKVSRIWYVTLPISRLIKLIFFSLGCMTYGDPQWRPWVLNEEQAAPIFQKAFEMGINFYDTGKYVCFIMVLLVSLIFSFYYPSNF